MFSSNCSSNRSFLKQVRIGDIAKCNILSIYVLKRHRLTCHSATAVVLNSSYKTCSSVEGSDLNSCWSFWV